MSFQSGAGGGNDLSIQVTFGADQSIPNAVETVLSFDTENFKTGITHDNVTNNSRITFPTAGKYLVHVHLNWQPNTVGRRYHYLRKNGATKIAWSFNPPSAVSDEETIDFSLYFNATANDYLEVLAYQNTGGAVKFDGNTLSPGYSYVEAFKTDKGG